MSLTKLIEVEILSSLINFPEHLRLLTLGKDEVTIQMSKMFSEVHEKEKQYANTIGGDRIDSLAFNIGHQYLESLRNYFIEKEDIAILNDSRISQLASSSEIESLKDIFSDRIGILFYGGQEVANITPTKDLGFLLNCDELIHEYIKANISSLNQHVMQVGEYIRNIRKVEPQIQVVKRSLAKLLSGEEVYKPIQPDYFTLDYSSLEDYQRVKSDLRENIKTGDLIEASVMGFTKAGKNENSPSSKAPYFNVAIDNKTTRVTIQKDDEYKENLSRQLLETMPINALMKIEITDVSNPTMVKASLKGMVYAN